MTLYVKDFVENNISDSDAIKLCLKKAALISGMKTVIFDGKDYLIDEAILVPDNIEIIIDGCMIKQKDNVSDNIFRGENVIIDKNDVNNFIDVKPIKNIKIAGENGAKIIGTDKPKIGYHSVLKEKQKMTGDFWGYLTHMFSFSLGDNIEICGLALSQTMGWAISFDNCCNVYVHDLDIRSNVKNGDGIDFRSGCHDCTVENITGFTSDDTIACTALSTREKTPRPLANYLIYSEPFNCLGREANRDIYNIKIRNIKTGGHHHGVICLAAHGNQVYNVSIEDFHETGEGERESTVKIYTGYGDGYNKGDIHDISVKNIYSKIAKFAVQVVADVENVTIENINQENINGELTYGIDTE